MIDLLFRMASSSRDCWDSIFNGLGDQLSVASHSAMSIAVVMLEIAVYLSVREKGMFDTDIHDNAISEAKYVKTRMSKILNKRYGSSL